MLFPPKLSTLLTSSLLLSPLHQIYNKKPRGKGTPHHFSSNTSCYTTALPKQTIVLLAEVNNSIPNRTPFLSSLTVFRVMDDFKRNQIPAFGNWDFSDGLPITQYFESARQAGLVRHSCGDRDLFGAVADDFLYSNPHNYQQHDLIKPPSITLVSRRKTKGGLGVPREKRYTNNNNNHNIKVLKKHGRVYDVTEPAKHHQQHHSREDYEVEQQYHHHQQHYIPTHPQRIPKAVDEDLYKIPPELLYKPKRNKMLGFFSCLVPTCAA